MMEAKHVAYHGRLARALGRRIDDVEAVAQALAIVTMYKVAVDEAVIRLRMEDRVSLSQLANGLGVAPQAVSQRWRVLTPLL